MPTLSLPTGNHLFPLGSQPEALDLYVVYCIPSVCFLLPTPGRSSLEVEATGVPTAQRGGQEAWVSTCLAYNPGVTAASRGNSPRNGEQQPAGLVGAEVPGLAFVRGLGRSVNPINWTWPLGHL